MKMTVESTSRMVTVIPVQSIGQPVECRVWEGVTEAGIKVQCLILMVAPEAGADLREFEADLLLSREPEAEPQALPLRMLL